MTPPDALFIRHMLEAVERVMEVTHKTTKDQFEREWVIQDALIRELEVLGEAAGRVSRELTSSHTEIPWREITGLRHKLIHDYFVVALDVVWDTATVDVPEVHLLLVALLEQVTHQE
jgi:uncharacterized protein with HEPN domain